jgi:hypothetical protein
MNSETPARNRTCYSDRTLLTTLLILAAFALAAIPTATAITYVDDADAEFQAGTLTNINASADTLTLPWNGTGYNASGTYTSRILDLGQNPAISIAWTFSTPSGTSVLVQTRTGASTDLLDGTWSAFSAAYAQSTGSALTSPRQRYVQYRISLGTTDSAATPTIVAVVVNSTEFPSTIALNAASYQNLTSNQFGANYSWTVGVSDTYFITAVTGAIRIDATGVWTAYANLTSLGNGNHTLTIPPPGGSWYALRGSTLFIDVIANVTNGSVNASANRTFTETIEFVSAAPVIDPIANLNATQGQNVTFAITATDFDNQTLTWSTNRSGATITATGNTSALFSWVPNATQLGLNTILVTASDGTVNGTRSFTVNVSDINDAPTLTAVPDFSGYYGLRQLLVLTAYDLDFTQNLTFTMSPEYFRIVASTVNPVGGNNSTSVPGLWYGVANFTPLDPERGTHNLTFTVSDGTLTANVTATMSIAFCGDGTCQATNEDAMTCRPDCVIETELPAIAMVAPDRNCANTTSTLRFFDAKDRFSCFYEGRVVGDRAFCDGLDGVAVTIYRVSGSSLTSVGTGTSGTNGTLTFQPGQAGTYRFVATREGYLNSTSTVVVQTCTSDIVVEETEVVVPQPPSSPTTDRDTARPPMEEEPVLLEEQASVLALLFIYVITPVLLASLLYFGNVFYDVNKDTLPWLLELRIKAFETRQRMDPTIQKVRVALRPVTDPLKALMDRTWIPYVWNPTKRALQPLLDRMNESLKKDGKPPAPK